MAPKGSVQEIGNDMAINRVTIQGNLTRDGELKKLADGTSVLNFGVAINEQRKDKKTGEWVDAPVFVECSIFGSRADGLAPFLTKGRRVTCDGRLRYHSWMKDEEKRSTITVVVTDFGFADSKGGKERGGAPAKASTQPVPAPEPELYDEDIPF